MNSRERIEATFKHTEPDRTPIFEYVLLPPITDYFLERPFIEYLGDVDKWLDMAKEKGWEQSVHQYVIDRLDLACKLEHDMIFICPNPLLGQSYFYDPLDVLGGRFAEDLSGNPVERIIQRNKRVSELMLDPPEDSFLVYNILKEEMERREIDLPILAHAVFLGIWTDADLMQTMILEPEVAKEHFSLASERALRLSKKYIANGIDQICIGGDFAGKRLLISPDSYRTFIVPEIRKVSRYIHSEGQYSINASDGDLWPVIEDFLLGCEVDGYLEIDMGAGMDLRRLKALYGDRITFYGNMDCGKILSLESPEMIRSLTIDILEAGTGNGGHIFCASNAITSSVSINNYLAMVNAYRETFGLKKIY